MGVLSTNEDTRSENEHLRVEAEVLRSAKGQSAPKPL